MTDCESLEQAVKDFLKLISSYREKAVNTKSVQEFNAIFPAPHDIMDKGEEILRKAIEEQ